MFLPTQCLSCHKSEWVSEKLSGNLHDLLEWLRGGGGGGGEGGVQLAIILFKESSKTDQLI